MNGGGTTGITNYTWNLGATPNGWKLPNGTAAPATYSTGTTSTLTLTPVCAVTQKNVSATVTANGINYNTNISTVSVTAPNISISGTNPLCGGNAVYTVAGLPCNATVTWGVTPSSGIVTYMISGNSITLTKTANATGVVTLTATISGNCSPLSTSTQIGVGSIIPNLVAQLISAIDDPTVYQFTATGIPSATYNWYVITNGTTALRQTGYSNVFEWYFPCNASRTIYCTVTTNCGTTTSPSITKTGGCKGANILVSPNPATNTVTIAPAPASASQSTVSFNEVKIYDQQGNLKKYQKTQKVKQMNLNVSDLI